MVSGATCTQPTVLASCTDVNAPYFANYGSYDQYAYFNQCLMEVPVGMYQISTLISGTWTTSNSFTYSCTGGYISNNLCKVAAASCDKTFMIPEVNNITASSQIDCQVSCFQTLNSTNSCASSCPSYNYAKNMYANCLPCESVAYDGGTVWSRSAQTCINTICKYFSIILVTSNTTIVSCEDSSDPPPNNASCYFYS